MSEQKQKNKGEALLAKYAKQSEMAEKKNEESHEEGCACGCERPR